MPANDMKRHASPSLLCHRSMEPHCSVKSSSVAHERAACGSTKQDQVAGALAVRAVLWSIGMLLRFLAAQSERDHPQAAKQNVLAGMQQTA